MPRETIIFVHGFASSNRGAKAQYLAERFQDLAQVDYYAIDLNPTPRDFGYMTITGMINRLRQFVLDRKIERARLMGSSLGGLVSVHYAHRYSGVDKLLLLAPVLRHWVTISDEEMALWEKTGMGPVYHFAFEKEIPLRYDYNLDGRQYQQFIPPAAPTLIIHGRQDDAVPIQHSRDYAQEYPNRVRLTEIDAEHTLNDQLPFIWKKVRSFLLEPEA